MTRHYLRFVDGFWRGLAACVGTIGCKRAALRLADWNDRMMGMRE